MFTSGSLMMFLLLGQHQSRNTGAASSWAIALAPPPQPSDWLVISLSRVRATNQNKTQVSHRGALLGGAVWGRSALS